MRLALVAILLIVGCEVKQPTYRPIVLKVWNAEEIKPLLIGRHTSFGKNIWTFEKEDSITISDVRLLKHVTGDFYTKCYIETRKPNSDNWLVGVLVLQFKDDRLDRVYGEGLVIKKEIR